MNKNGQKDFGGWIIVKEDLHERELKRSIREGEIWWCAVGENVGREICGKGKDFSRPVLIIHKLSEDNFLGVPLTSKRHTGSWYVKFGFKEKNEYAVLAQVENISIKRLYSKMGEIRSNDFNRLLEGLSKLVMSRIK